MPEDITELIDIACTVLMRSPRAVTVSAGGRRREIPHQEIQAEQNLPDGRTLLTLPGALVQRLELAEAHTVTVADIALRFGHSKSWLSRNLERLIREERFPKPITKIGHPKWDPPTVDAWFRRHHPEPVKPAGESPEETHRLIEETYGRRRDD